jgi:hypothetical protein
MTTDLNTLTYGIEIECCIPSAALAANGWQVGGYHAGAPIPGFPGWLAMHDSSIRAQYPRVGVEVVSPVLSGPDGMAQIHAMLTKLTEIGATVNRSTGFHVHVGFTGTPAQLRRLICFVAYHEKALYASTGTTSREHNQFCSSIKATHRALSELHTMEELARHQMSRYHVLNLTNLQRGTRKTVEFRVFAGTLNATKIAAYVQICLGMVQKTADSNAPLPWDAPASAKQQRESARPGAWAMRQLIAQLGWYEHGDRKAYGVFNRADVPTLARKLRQLADKYDGPVRAN